MNCLPWIFFWFAGLPSQKWVCPSMTKISSPLAVLYMAFLPFPHEIECHQGSPLAQPVGPAGTEPARHRSRLSLDDVLHHLVHVSEQHDRVIVGHHHPPVMGRG